MPKLKGTPRKSIGFGGKLEIKSCQYCAADVLASSEADTVTCGTCLLLRAASAEPED